MQMRCIEHVEQRVFVRFTSALVPRVSALAGIMLRLLSDRIAHRCAILNASHRIIGRFISKINRRRRIVL